MSLVLALVAAPGHRERSPLHFAMAPRVVCALYALHADVDSRDANQATPLFHLLTPAERGYRTSLVLLELGADPNATNCVESALMLAVRLPLPRVVPLLLSFGAAPDTISRSQAPIHVACAQGDVQALTHLLSYGARGDLMSEVGTAPIHEAASPAVIRRLAEYGVNIDQPTAAGDTALIIAMRREDPRCCEELIRLGANVRAAGRDGRTPMWWAQRSSPKVRVLVLQAAAEGNPAGRCV